MHWQDYRLERAWQYADFLMQTVKQRPAELLKQIKPETKGKSLQQKLSDLYVAGCSTSFKNKNLFGGSHLLEKLVAKEKLNCLIVNLYAGNEGYSLMLKTRTGGDTETIRLPYEEGEILQYIDNEELPPLLIDLLERSQANLFYNGCVIVEVRDYRRTSNPATCDYRHVLLRPTTQSIISDVGMLTSDGQRWTWDERQALEANLLLATSEPLCLDPSISVAILANHLHYRKHLFSRRTFKRLARKHSQATINKKRKFEHCTAPPDLKLYDFLAKRRNKLSNQPIGLKFSKQVVDNCKRPDVYLEAPSVLEVEMLAKAIPKPESKDCDLVIAEEHIMEADKSSGKISQNRITILYSPLEELYYGKLCSGQDPSQTETKRFHLGSKRAVTKYVKQFKRIFTQEGKKCVKMTHIVPGQPPKIKYTPGIMEMSTVSLNTVSVNTDSTVMSAENKTMMETTEGPPPKKMMVAPKLSSPVTNAAPNIQDIKSPPAKTAVLSSLIAAETSPSSQTKNQSPPTTTASTQSSSNEILLSPVSSPSSAEVVQPAPPSNIHNPLAVENLVSSQNLLPAVNLSGFGIGLQNLVTLSSITPSATAVISIANPTQPCILPSGGIVTGIGSKNTCSLTTTTSMSAAVSSITPMITSGEVATPAIDVENMVTDIAPAVVLSSGNITPQLMTSGLKVSNLRSSNQASLQMTGSQANPIITEAHSVRNAPPNIAPISSWSSVASISTHGSNQQKSPSSTGDGSSPLQSSSVPVQRRHKLQVSLQKQFHQQPRQQHTPPSSSSRTKTKKKSSSGGSSSK